MGVDRSEVISPTFVLLRSHRGDHCNLHHLDAYRVLDETEWWETGIDECLEDPGCVTVVEWADRFPDAMPEETLWLRLRSEVADGLEAECGEAESVPRVMTVHASTQMLSPLDSGGLGSQRAAGSRRRFETTRLAANRLTCGARNA